MYRLSAALSLTNILDYGRPQQRDDKVGNQLKQDTYNLALPKIPRICKKLSEFQNLLWICQKSSRFSKNLSDLRVLWNS